MASKKSKKAARKQGAMHARAAANIDAMAARPSRGGGGGGSPDVLVAAFVHASDALRDRPRQGVFAHHLEELFQQLILSLQVKDAAPYVRKQMANYMNPMSTRGFRDSTEWANYLELFARELRYAEKKGQLYPWTIVAPATLGLGTAFATAVYMWVNSKLPTGNDADKLTDEVIEMIERTVVFYSRTVAS